MKFSEFPFLRYTLFFILGVLVYPYLGFLSFNAIVYLNLGLFLFYLILVVIDAYQITLRFKLLFPLTAFSLLVSMGILFTFLKDAKNDPRHLLHQTAIKGYVGVVEGLDQQKPNTFANHISVRAVKIGNKFVQANGEVIIYHQLPEQLSPGQLVWIEGRPETIAPPKNPHEFDYRDFLANQQVYHSHFVGKSIVSIGNINHQPINKLVLQARAFVLEKMDRFIFTPYSNQIAKALLLGQKKELDKDINAAYVTAGTMHVLAVSGLHVGIIYGFFFLFLKPYQLSTRKRAVYLSLVISIIWVYALVTGMSPSVMRAATMFTLMGLAQMKSRNPSIFNAVALSAMILLVFDPFILFTVGFQLSYMAVLGIVLFQPKIAGWWEPRNWAINYLWQISSVGIAAQLATFPIAVHYFHVFPTYFMFSNLIAIPGAFLIMSIGIPFMLLSFSDRIGKILGKLLDLIIDLENQVIFSFQQFPFARIDQINFSPVEMVLYWLLIGFIYLLFLENRKKFAYLSLLVLFGLVLSNWIFWWRDFERKELYLYGLDSGIAVDFFYGGKLYTHMEGVAHLDLSYKVSPNRTHKGYRDYHPLWYRKEARSKQLLLPDQTMLTFIDQKLELTGLPIQSFSQFQDGEWLLKNTNHDLAFDGNAYRIVLK